MPAEPQQQQRREEEKKPAQKSTDERIAELEAALAQSRIAAPLNPIPEHGAGPGTGINETWSLAEQEHFQRGGSAVP